MRVSRWLMGVVGSTLLVLVVAGNGSAFGANETRAAMETTWQQSMSRVRTPGPGCYHATFPNLKWTAGACDVAPNWPMEPPAAPMKVVGNGHDFSAEVTGTISKATGSFDDVSPTITESGQEDDQGAKLPNTFTLQLNTQFFSGSPACSGAASPTKCLAWQQFVYETSSNLVFMQYWLIYFDKTCPSGWESYSAGTSTTDCYKNSPASSLPGSALTAAGLATSQLEGIAASGGNDEVSLSNGSGQATEVTNPDSVLDLSAKWNTTEWGVFGDGGGGEAYFGPKTTLEAQTALNASSQSAPSCVDEGFTAETNNLKLTNTPAIGSQPSPTMVSKQTNHKAKHPGCATSA